MGHSALTARAAFLFDFDGTKKRNEKAIGSRALVATYTHTHTLWLIIFITTATKSHFFLFKEKKKKKGKITRKIKLQEVEDVFR